MTDVPTEDPIDCDPSLEGRQLAALRVTYPAWEISCDGNRPSADRWTAELRRQTTATMKTSGIRPRITSPDAVTLASTLAHQSALIHNGRAGNWPR
jgi:hypothetical protein